MLQVFLFVIVLKSFYFICFSFLFCWFKIYMDFLAIEYQLNSLPHLRIYFFQCLCVKYSPSAVSKHIRITYSSYSKFPIATDNQQRNLRHSHTDKTGIKNKSLISLENHILITWHTTKLFNFYTQRRNARRRRKKSIST